MERLDEMVLSFESLGDRTVTSMAGHYSKFILKAIDLTCFVCQQKGEE
jgi:hypothetical protein